MYKLTQKDIDNLTFEEIYEKMDKDTQAIMYGHICDTKYNILQIFQDCESPIERKMAYALDCFDLFRMHAFNSDIELDNYEKQAVITCDKNNYRVDFLIEIIYHKLGIKKSFIVECDGHDFHEKTKEQVIKNNTRDRELSNKGYIILRFSGSEIMKRGAHKCASEIIKIIISHSKK